jgi:hypothetical protein
MPSPPTKTKPSVDVVRAGEFANRVPAKVRNDGDGDYLRRVVTSDPAAL